METIKKRREEFEQLGKLYPKAASVNVQQALINGVNCYWFIPENPVANKIIIHLHGGVYAVGSIRSHESLVSHIAQKLNTTVVFVEYALSPERPYPAAINDVFAVYTALLKEYSGYKIGFIGDSAGGGLIVSTVGDLLKQYLPLPYAVAMISPWISLQDDNPSQETNRAKDPILSKEYLQRAAKDYVGHFPVEAVSPDKVIISEFPPVLLAVGSNEILLDDSMNFYEAVKGMQPDSILTIYEDQNHVWPLANINSEASRKLLAKMENFFNNK
ncbi:alpha/beta hydrolase fold domain-containing protein [Spirosoma jeollabukense]